MGLLAIPAKFSAGEQAGCQPSGEVNQKNANAADLAIRRLHELLGLQLSKDFVKSNIIMVKDTNDYKTLGGNVQDPNDAAMSSIS